jgi:hypothetical protein
MGVEKRRAAKRNREVAFALQSQATGTGKKQAGQVRVLKLIEIGTQWAPSGSLKRGTHGIGDLPTVSRAQTTSAVEKGHVSLAFDSSAGANSFSLGLG